MVNKQAFKEQFKAVSEWLSSTWWVNLLTTAAAVFGVILGGISCWQVGHYGELEQHYRELEQDYRELEQDYREQEQPGSVTVRVVSAIDFDFPNSTPEPGEPHEPETVLTLEIANPGGTTIRDVWLFLPEGVNATIWSHASAKLKGGKQQGLWVQNIGAGQTVTERLNIKLPNTKKGYAAFVDYGSLTLVYTAASGERWQVSPGDVASRAKEEYLETPDRFCVVPTINLPDSTPGPHPAPTGCGWSQP